MLQGKITVKSYWIAALVGVGLLLQTASATAWWQSYQLEIPFGPPLAMWYSQNIPQGPATGVAPGFWFYRNAPTVSGQTQPGFWYQQSVPGGAASGWSFSGPMSGLFVEQSQSPAGYSIRVQGGQQGAQDIGIRIEGSVLIVRRHSAACAVGTPLQMQQAGWTTQLIALPADANLAAMRVARRLDGIDIFIPRGG